MAGAIGLIEFLLLLPCFVFVCVYMFVSICACAYYIISLWAAGQAHK
jgi:hypothetical protein